MSETVYLKSAAGTQQAFYVEEGVKLSDGNGGWIPFSDARSDVPWLGPGTEHVSKFYDQTTKLQNTDFATWTPATTASAIIASATAATRSVNMALYEYTVRWRVLANVVYQDGTVKKAAIVQHCDSLWQQCYRRPDTIARIEAGTFNHNYCTSLQTASTYSFYYNTSGNLAFTTGSSYGIYPSITAASFASTTADETTLTLKTPAINARCSTSIFSTAMAAAVDQEASTVRIVGDIYRTPVGWSVVRKCYEDAMAIHNDGL